MIRHSFEALSLGLANVSRFLFLKFTPRFRDLKNV